MPIKVAIIGISGKTGREVGALALSDSGFGVVGGVVAPGSEAVGMDVGSLCGHPPAGIPATDDLRGVAVKADVLIEFTDANASMANMEVAAELGRPVVNGSTGFSASQFDRVAQLSRKIPILLAPNMSAGLNALARVLPALVRSLGPSFDVEIVDAHHRYKKDAPSGTALQLARVIAQAMEQNLEDVATYGRQGLAPRQQGELGIHAVRAGGLVSEHTIVLADDGEAIEIRHRILNRRAFASGALRGARFLVRQAPGLYSMADVLEQPA